MSVIEVSLPEESLFVQNPTTRLRCPRAACSGGEPCWYICLFYFTLPSLRLLEQLGSASFMWLKSPRGSSSSSPCTAHRRPLETHVVLEQLHVLSLFPSALWSWLAFGLTLAQLQKYWLRFPLCAFLWIILQFQCPFSLKEHFCVLNCAVHSFLTLFKMAHCWNVAFLALKLSSSGNFLRLS